MDGPRSKPTDQLSWVSVHGEIREVRRIVRNVRDLHQETEIVPNPEDGEGSEGGDSSEDSGPLPVARQPELVPPRMELAPLFRHSASGSHTASGSPSASAGGGMRRPPGPPDRDEPEPSYPGPSQTLQFRPPPPASAFPTGRTVQTRATVRGSQRGALQSQPFPEPRLQLELPHRIKPEPRPDKPTRKGGPILPFFGGASTPPCSRGGRPTTTRAWATRARSTSPS
jgi:hypothetical protein